MSTRIFVNLPVKDLAKSKNFFVSLGFPINPQFTDDNAACIVVSDDICVMLLVEPMFKGFTPLPVADATKATEVLIALSRPSREEVDAIVAKGVAAGARTFKEPTDHGFMYIQSFIDLDGHIWEWAWMDPSFVNKG